MLLKGKYRTDSVPGEFGAEKRMLLIAWSMKLNTFERPIQSCSCQMHGSKLKTGQSSSNFNSWKHLLVQVRIQTQKLIPLKSTFRPKLSTKTQTTTALISKVPLWKMKAIGSDCPIGDNPATAGRCWQFLPWCSQSLWFPQTQTQVRLRCFSRPGRHKPQTRQ